LGNNDPVASDGWIEAGTIDSNTTMSSNVTLVWNDSLTNSSDSILMNMVVPGGASGGTQSFDYRIKYTWA